MEFTNQEKLMQQVVHKAWEDATFKQELINAPLEAIEKLIGAKMNIPEGKTLVIRDQTDESTVYINIPAAPTTDDVELNETQLEAVAGGASVIIGGIHDVIDCFPTPVIDVKAPDNFLL
ncbi:hypothetical protein GCM10022393_41150 [Aquimarina addita]|uniref:NHLP leader peptide family natural product n=1 Tax=Aquimarina addita TaxID=870485 RepID=A0ABP6UXX3_9FLAO